VGGGFLGSELACALAHRTKEGAQNGKPSGKIIQLMPEKGNEIKYIDSILYFSFQVISVKYYQNT
jgi:hypothetical protein